MLVVVTGFAFVGHQDVPAIGGEGEHVGQGADVDGTLHLAVDIHQHDLAGVGFYCVLHRRGDQAFVHRDAVDAAAVGRQVDAEQQAGLGRVANVQYVDPRVGGVDHEQALGARVVGDDLGSALLEQAALVSAERGEGECLRLAGGNSRQSEQRREGNGGGEQARAHGAILIDGCQSRCLAMMAIV